MQDVECRQPHGKKVPTIAEQSSPPPDTSDEPLLRTALKRSASALKADGVPFALGGGYALWVAGGPEPSHDVDLVVAETDIETAANSLAAAGLRIERPPEDWLFKAYCDEAIGDLPSTCAGRCAASARRRSRHDTRCLTPRMNMRSWASGFRCCRRLPS